MQENIKNIISTEETNRKLHTLKQYLESLGPVAVAFSSGVDSTFLLKVAHDLLGERVIALTAVSGSFPERESREAVEFCQKEGIRQIVFNINELEIEGFRENPKNRCYICKKALFRNFQKIAAENGFPTVIEGSNVDDEGDYRPGMQAIAELGIKSPLRYSRLTKAEIRTLSRAYSLPTWDKPSYACLASRFVYGETITPEKLRMVDQGEQLLLDLGFRQMRVRIHGLLARIELLPEDLPKILEPEIRTKIVTSFQQYGFTYVSLDLRGYRTGSMNETIKQE